jgi:hypothetical protein
MVFTLANGITSLKVESVRGVLTPYHVNLQKNR